MDTTPAEATIVDLVLIEVQVLIEVVQADITVATEDIRKDLRREECEICFSLFYPDFLFYKNGILYLFKLILHNMIMVSEEG